jgi:hypothetical protein
MYMATSEILLPASLTENVVTPEGRINGKQERGS